MWLAVFVLAAQGVNAGPFISEILFNPQGSDAPNQYIELRGSNNYILPAGTYLIAVDGQTNGNPGAIQDIFDLSGRAIGGNGYLVLLQKTNLYAANSNATVLVNTGSDPGWGDGSGSSIGHRGKNGKTDLSHNSQTFFLIQTPNPPAIGSDIDADNNGVPDGPIYGNWTIWDSVGILDANAGIAYGKINFRRNPTGIAPASSTVVSVDFNPDYVGRTSNTTGWAASDWVASSSLGGSAVTTWTLGSAVDTVPASYAGQLLNHIGGPNFGALESPGVVVRQSGGSTDVVEGSGTDFYSIGLNTTPLGPVTIKISASGQTRVSTNGVSFASTVALTLTNSTTFRTVTVRALGDSVVDISPHTNYITHAITNTSDAVRYPTNSLMPIVNVRIADTNVVLLNELDVNPPGTNDAPYEYIELRGVPNTLLSNVYVLAIEGDASQNPGRADLVVKLNGVAIGPSGLLIIVAPDSPYATNIPGSGTAVVLAPDLSLPGGALGNGTISFLLVTSSADIPEGIDLDAGDNGVLEGLPAGTTILDAVGWSKGGNGDIVYGGVVLTQPSGTPDAASRFVYNTTPKSAAAWYNGDLVGPNADSVIYDSSNVSTNFPYGAILRPGYFASSPPGVSPLAPFSSVIGDPTSTSVDFIVTSAQIDPSLLLVTASSDNPAVVPDANLTVLAGSGGLRTLVFNPIGVGYATITLTVDDGNDIGQITMKYAASAEWRPGGRWHTGTSDASTALAIDGNFMFVGDNENEVLRLFYRDISGLPIRGFDVTPYLGLTDMHADGTPKEVNIEGSTRVGNRFFWIGAHSFDALAEPAPNRNRIFATDMSGTGANATLTYVGRYDYLKADLVNWDVNNGHGKGANYYGLAASTVPGVNPKATNGFNIEGLAMAPGSTTVGYIGFRAPIVPATNRLFALVVPVLNFTILAISGGPAGSAVFGSPIELDLGGRGIRSFEGNAFGYLIVAGPPSDYPDIPPADFVLYTWSGNAGDAAQLRAADLTGITGEGVVDLANQPWTPSTQSQLVSDNGRKDFYGDGIQAKYLPEPNFRKFRSDWVTLGPVIIPPPQILSLSASGSNLTIAWRAVAGHTYRIQYSPDLNQNAWGNVSGDVLATYPIASKTFTDGGWRQRFYRIIVVQ